MKPIEQSPLGKVQEYCQQYNPDLLFPIARELNRQQLGFGAKLPFFGVDVWTAYELSWLNPKGKPIVAMAEFSFPASSPNIIESKSFKLYLNSFNGTKFSDEQEVLAVLQQDLSSASGAEVVVKIIDLNQAQTLVTSLEGAICLDDQDIEIAEYSVNPSLLSAQNQLVEETLYSNLLKSNCLVTGQPDWATLVISYRGKQLDHASLLRYIVSFRNHNEFHEHCVERIFQDLSTQCQPESLTVYARYLRRGGLDINPYRSTLEVIQPMPRFVRQ